MKSSLYNERRIIFMTNEEVYEMNKQMRSQGYTEKEIAEELGITISLLRNKIGRASRAMRVDKMSKVVQLKMEGYSNVKIGWMLGINESNVRYLLKKSKDPIYTEEMMEYTKRFSLAKNTHENQLL